MINLCLTALIPRGQRLDFNSSNLGSPSAWLEKARVGRPAKLSIRGIKMLRAQVPEETQLLPTLKQLTEDKTVCATM